MVGRRIVEPFEPVVDALLSDEPRADGRDRLPT
jgi:hypothetical protein